MSELCGGCRLANLGLPWARGLCPACDRLYYPDYQWPPQPASVALVAQRDRMRLCECSPPDDDMSPAVVLLALDEEGPSPEDLPRLMALAQQELAALQAAVVAYEKTVKHLEPVYGTREAPPR